MIKFGDRPLLEMTVKEMEKICQQLAEGQRPPKVRTGVVCPETFVIFGKVAIPVTLKEKEVSF